MPTRIGHPPARQTGVLELPPWGGRRPIRLIARHREKRRPALRSIIASAQLPINEDRCAQAANGKGGHENKQCSQDSPLPWGGPGIVDSACYSVMTARQGAMAVKRSTNGPASMGNVLQPEPPRTDTRRSCRGGKQNLSRHAQAPRLRARGRDEASCVRGGRLGDPVARFENVDRSRRRESGREFRRRELGDRRH